jgi:hypothetical protein
MCRVLNQAANAAVKAEGTIFAIGYRRLVPRLGHAQAIGANRASAVSPDLEDASPGDSVRGTRSGRRNSKQARARKMIRELRSLGHHVELPSAPSAAQHDRERFRPWTAPSPKRCTFCVLLSPVKR